MTPLVGRNLVAPLARLAPPLPADVSGPVPPRATGPRATSGGTGADVLPTVLARAAASGHPASVAARLADLWPDLDLRSRAQIAEPLRAGRDGVVRLGRSAAVQTSTTTCGSAVLVLLAAAGDPVLATWLVTGRLVGSAPELVGARGADGASSGAGESPAERFAEAQRVMLRATSRRALGPFPWPTAFGTPPWAAARRARFPGMRYSHRPVDDRDRPKMTRLLAWVAASASRGVPVPLYAGGDLAQGLATAMPRHVVLVVPDVSATGALTPTAAGPGRLAVYEPARGRVHRIDPDELVGRRTPHPALGQWTHVCWAVLPRAVGGRVQPA